MVRQGFVIDTHEDCASTISDCDLSLYARPVEFCLGGSGTRRNGDLGLHKLADDASCPVWVQVPPPPVFRLYLPMVVQ